MGKGDWVQRQPGSAAGSVVPPPAPETPPLPKRVPRRASDHQSARSAQAAASAGQQVPDSIRALLKPVWTPDPAAIEDQVRSAEVDSGSAEAEPAAGRKRLRRDRAGSSRRPLTWVAVLTFILLAAGGTAVALSRQHVGSRSENGTQTPAGSGGRAAAGLSEAAAVRQQTAAWISGEISRSAIVACDSVMCTALYRAGVPASNLLVLSPDSLDPLGADLVVATPVLRSLFGSRLQAVYAPTVLASFGSGQTRVEVLIVAPDGAAAYLKALSQDVAARKVAGATLLGNSKIRLSADAAAQLSAGQVDPRLLLLLPVMATLHPLQILAFGDQAPGASNSVPLTAVELSGSDRAASLTARSYLRWLLGFLHGQRTPYRPAGITSIRRGGRQIVIVRFARPTPIGLLPSG